MSGIHNLARKKWVKVEANKKKKGNSNIFSKDLFCFHLE